MFDSLLDLEAPLARDLQAALARELSVPCLCDVAACYCPAHGEYRPATRDPEIIDAVAAGSVCRAARRVVRKPLDD